MLTFFSVFTGLSQTDNPPPHSAATASGSQLQQPPGSRFLRGSYAFEKTAGNTHSYSYADDEWGSYVSYRSYAPNDGRDVAEQEPFGDAQELLTSLAASVEAERPCRSQFALDSANATAAGKIEDSPLLGKPVNLTFQEPGDEHPTTVPGTVHRVWNETMAAPRCGKTHALGLMVRVHKAAGYANPDHKGDVFYKLQRNPSGDDGSGALAWILSAEAVCSANVFDYPVTMPPPASSRGAQAHEAEPQLPDRDSNQTMLLMPDYQEADPCPVAGQAYDLDAIDPANQATVPTLGDEVHFTATGWDKIFAAVGSADQRVIDAIGLLLVRNFRDALRLLEVAPEARHAFGACIPSRFSFFALRGKLIKSERKENRNKHSPVGDYTVVVSRVIPRLHPVVGSHRCGVFLRTNSCASRLRQQTSDRRLRRVLQTATYARAQ